MGKPSTRDETATELPSFEHRGKRTVSILRRVLFTIAILLAALSGIWFLGVRPSLQQQAVLQIDRTLNQAEGGMQMLLSADMYQSPQNSVLSEKSLSHALTVHNAYASQDWQVTITPANVTTILSFPGCGQNCTLTVVLNVGNFPGNYVQLQVISAHAQGMLALVLSDGELVNVLTNNVQIFNWSLTHLAMKITLLEHAIDVQLHEGV